MTGKHHEEKIITPLSDYRKKEYIWLILIGIVFLIGFIADVFQPTLPSWIYQQTENHMIYQTLFSAQALIFGVVFAIVCVICKYCKGTSSLFRTKNFKWPQFQSYNN